MIMTIRFALRLTALVLAVGLLPSREAPAIIILGDGGRNLGPAPDNLSNYVGLFGDVIATPITPRHFVTAAHVGAPSPAQFLYANGTGTVTTYTAVGRVVQNDLAVYTIADSDPDFTLFAPVYTLGDEVGRDLVTIGRGTVRGAEVRLAGQLRGWSWGANDGQVSWGTNRVETDLDFPETGPLLSFTFDRITTNDGQLLNPNEGTYSARDSGGPVFIQDDSGVWKLAGINYAVDGPFSTSAAGPYANAALFDASAFWIGSPDDPFFLNPTDFPSPTPAGAYATRVSAHYNFLEFATGGLVVPEPRSLMLLVLGATLAAVPLLRGTGPMRRTS